MQTVRQRIATLIEPVYICVLTAAWVVPLVGSALTQTARQGGVMPITVLACVVVCAVGVAAGLPSRYFEIGGFERSGTVYRRVGVRWLRRVAPYGTITQRLVRALGRSSRDGSLSISRAPLIGVAQTRSNERVHVAAVIVAFGSTLQLLLCGQLGRGAYLLVVGCVSVLCLCLQRYNRARLERIAGRLPWPPS